MSYNKKNLFVWYFYAYSFKTRNRVQCIIYIESRMCRKIEDIRMLHLKLDNY